jgi:serine/threonine protein kinase
MKEMNLEGISEKEKEMIENEARLLKRLKHKSIIKYKTKFRESDKFYLIMEEADGKSHNK